jgi:hypothetical protein
MHAAKVSNLHAGQDVRGDSPTAEAGFERAAQAIAHQRRRRAHDIHGALALVPDGKPVARHVEGAGLVSHDIDQDRPKRLLR